MEPEIVPALTKTQLRNRRRRAAKRAATAATAVDTESEPEVELPTQCGECAEPDPEKDGKGFYRFCVACGRKKIDKGEMIVIKQLPLNVELLPKRYQRNPDKAPDVVVHGILQKTADAYAKALRCTWSCTTEGWVFYRP
jgi:hypothetical protein